MVNLDNSIKNLIDSLEYQIRRLQVIERADAELSASEETLTRLKSLYDNYIHASGPSKAKLEKELLSYVKLPTTMSIINKSKRYVAALALFGLLGGGALYGLKNITSQNSSSEVTQSNPTTDLDQEFNVTFSDGGAVLSTETYHLSDSIVCPEPEAKEGYDFLGWFYENGSMYHAGDDIASDTVLQAKWVNIKFDTIEEFQDYCYIKTAEASADAFCVFIDEVCALNFLNANDYLSLIDALKYNVDFLSKIDVTLALTPEDIPHIPEFLLEKTSYKISLKGDFTNVSLKSVLSNLDITNVSLKEAQISEEDMAYFINKPNIFLSILNSSFKYWKTLDSLRDSANIPEYLIVAVNNDMGSDFFFLTGKTIEVIVPADKLEAAFICNSEKTIINLEIEDSSNLNNININSMDSKEIMVNVTLKDSYTKDIKTDPNFIRFMGMLLSPNPINVKIENTGEIISVAITESGYTIINSNLNTDEYLNNSSSLEDNFTR